MKHSGLIWFFAMLLCSAAHPQVNGADYLKDVKPILEHKCFACHGALKQQSSLRLDTGNAILKGGESGVVVIPGKPNESLLLQVITGEAGFQMPPANEGSPLTDEEQSLIRDWIASGASIPEQEEPQADPRSWWSYRPIQRPAVPDVRRDKWSRNDIDRFIAARRKQQKLGYSEEATRSQWIRRVYLDLIGLPPTRDELSDFFSDDSNSAYEAVVDNLLSRPQYGERWGRHWMDIWRYSDWYGSRGINEIRYSQRHIWRWRDWIVDSLNEDKGYDQMVREMLAADEIAGDDAKTVAATGYIGRNWYKFDRDVRLFDTVERTGEAFLGLTLRCARCHDHKYDPISHEDYYRFRAFFEPQYVRTDRISALTGKEKDATLGEVLTDGIPVAFDLEHDRVTYRFERGDSRFPDESKVMLPGVPASLGGDELIIEQVELPPAAWYPILRDGVRETLLDQADAEIQVATERLTETKAEANELRLKIAKAKADPNSKLETESVFVQDDFSKPNNDVWNILSGNWVYEDGKLIEKDVTSFATIATKMDHPRDFVAKLRYKALQPGGYRSIGFSFDFIDTGTSQDVYTSTNDNRQTVQAFHRVGGKQTYPREGIVYTPLKVGEEVTLKVTVNGQSLTIDLNGERKLDYEMPIERQDGKFSLWVHRGSAEFLELKITALTESLETLQRRLRSVELAIETAQLDVKLAEAKRQSVDRRLAATVASLINSSDDSPMLTRQASIAELHVKEIEAEAELLKVSNQTVSEEQKKALEAAENKLHAARAAVQSPGDSFEPLGEQHAKTSTGRRTALANWIASDNNPRTARVAANHIWNRHFGQPLVATTENFGLNGRKPTHPALLDWLAAELIDNDWRMKPIHRQIVLSAAYRMSTRSSSSEDLMKDPQNIYFWRMNSRRMEAEVVRDSVLYLSGQLDLTRGGPEIPETDGENLLRRSMYFRNTPNEKMDMLEVFDVADPNSCYRRKESVVPHQSLAMMNSGLTLDSARIIAAKLSESAETDDAFVRLAFEAVLSRSPSRNELARCQTFLQDHAELLANDDSEKFVGSSTAKRAPATAADARARENLIHVLLLHNDFVTVR